MEKTPAQLKKLQKKCLEITLVFKKFCEDNGLLFYLCGGGAVGEDRIRFDFATLVDVDEIESVRVDGVEIALG